MITISCIIPTLNEENNIRNLISSIKDQKLPNDEKVVEIIVVDNASSDDTTTIARDMGTHVYIIPDVSIGALRNIGASKASGDVLLFLDADNILTENAIHSLVNKLYLKEIGAIGVHLKPFNEHNWVPSVWHYHLCPEETGYHETNAIASGAFIMRKDVFFEIGGFNEALDVGEDTDLSRKIIKLGYKILLDTETKIYNLGYPKTILSFVRREIWHGDSWRTILSHKNIDSLTVYLTLNVILLSLSTIGVMKGFPRITILSIAYIFLPPLVKAYVKRRKIDLLFLQLFILYILYILSRTISLFKYRTRILY